MFEMQQEGRKGKGVSEGGRRETSQGVNGNLGQDMA